MNQIEKVARAIIGPHEPVPASSRYTLDELREVRWRQITSDERSMALREAKAAIAAMQPAPQKPVAWEQYHPLYGVTLFRLPLTDRNKAAGWTETPLYAHPPAQWQGIESAPRDGTRFLAWCPYVGRVIMRIDGVHRETWAIDPLGRVGCNPTHWMPLPTPPAGGSDEVR